MKKYFAAALLYTGLALNIATAKLPIASQTYQEIQKYEIKLEKEKITAKNNFIKKLHQEFENCAITASKKFNNSLYDKTITNAELTNTYEALEKVSDAANKIASYSTLAEVPFEGDIKDLYDMVKSDYEQGTSKLQKSLRKQGLEIKVENNNIPNKLDLLKTLFSTVLGGIFLVYIVEKIKNN